MYFEVDIKQEQNKNHEQGTASFRNRGTPQPDPHPLQTTEVGKGQGCTDSGHPSHPPRQGPDEVPPRPDPPHQPLQLA